MNMKITGIIPARYGSTRFPGKPLALLDGRPMLLHVFEHASESRLLTGIFAATESPNLIFMVRIPLHSLPDDRSEP